MLITKNGSRTTARFYGTLFTLLSLMGLQAHAANKTPEEVYATRANNLDTLPEGAILSNPLKLVVSFSLDFAPNSPEADAFLNTWYASISALPDDVTLEIYRPVAPDTYQYAVGLTFNNWEEYRTYETRPEFLQYYYDHWKPHVTAAEERLYVLNTVELP